MDTAIADTLMAPSPLCKVLNSEQSVHIAHCNSSPYSPQVTMCFSNSFVSISLIFSALRTFPSEFSQLPELQRLDLHGNELEGIGNSSGTFGNLTYLDLSYNNIKFLEKGFLSTIKHVLFLNLSHNALRTVDADLHGFMTNCDRKIALRVDVDLSYNKIVNATPNTADLYSSKPCYRYYPHSILNLSYNNITLMSDILFSWWQQPEFLTDLTTGKARLNTLPSELPANLPFLPNQVIEIVWDNNPLMLDCIDCMLYKESGLIEREKLNTSQLHARYASDNEDAMTNTEMICKLKDVYCPVNCACLLDGCSLKLELECQYLSALPLNIATNFLRSYSFNYMFHLLYRIHLRDSEIHDILSQEYFEQVYQFVASNNSITNIEYKALLMLSVSIEALDISHNNLTTLPEVLDWPKLRYLYIHNNPWRCDCNILWMKSWIIHYATRFQQRNTICASPFYNAGHQLSTLPNWRFICLSTIVGITVSVVTLITIIVSSTLVYKWRFWLYQRYGFHPFDKDECDNEDKKFDVFVSYSNEDYEWARELMAELENLGFRVCCHEGDFLAGTTISENVARAVHFSKRTLCIVSRAFMASSICMHEFITARSFDFSYKKARLLVIMNEDIAMEDLHEDIRMYVKSFTYLKRDCPFFMKRLLYRLPLKKLGHDENTPLLLDTHV